ncbi:hypothetical protein ABZS86_06475 [Streptomyces sp. NPDC005355]|uniref:hypothetical protein n=1 Tax=Streptomyces sp. NPDC005355 TaxID=3157038 RepID=UPI0033B71AA8
MTSPEGFDIQGGQSSGARGPGQYVGEKPCGTRGEGREGAGPLMIVYIHDQYAVEQRFRHGGQ